MTNKLITIQGLITLAEIRRAVIPEINNALRDAKVIDINKAPAKEQAGRGAPDRVGEGYRITNKFAGEVEVFLYDDIGDSWFGGISAKAFAEELKAFGDLDLIRVRINSEGGSVFDGIAIYNTLVSNKARVVVHIDSLAASIASVVAMAGDEIIMAENATMMIHNPWGVFAGDADELRQQADLLDKVRGQLLTTYVSSVNARAGDDTTPATEAELGAMMDAETWLTAPEALAAGLIDNVSLPLKVAAKIDPARFKNTPKALTEPESVVQKGSNKLDQDARVQLSKMSARVSAMNKP